MSIILPAALPVQAPAWAVTPNWYLNGALVYTGGPFISSSTGGSVTLPASSFTYTTAGSYTGTNGLVCVLSWGGTAPGACVVTTSVTGTPTSITVQNPPVAITGPTSTCASTTVTITLSDASGGGFWTSSNTAIANVGSSSGIVSGAGTAGTVVITYSNSCASVATTTITTIASPGAITSSAPVACSGSSITLSDAVGGGSWNSSNTTVATIDPITGVLTGGTPGTATINYTTGCGTNAHATGTVRTTPGIIFGATTVCSGSPIVLSDGVGGTWSSSSTTVATVGSSSGVVTGGAVSGVTAVITYSTGCGTNATTTVTVLGGPVAIAGGTVPICTGTLITLSDATAGGTWSSDNSAVATIDPNTGALIGTGTTGGTADITYSTGCGADALITVSVTASPSPITGAIRVCSGLNIVLHDLATGGTWTSSNTTIAVITPSFGVITGGAAGVATITYTTGCGAAVTRTVTVYAPPNPTITGSAFSICSGSFATLSDVTAGGTWSSDNISIASINSSSGAVTGESTGGVANITYSTGCGSDAYTTMTVTAIPGPISGQTTVCSSSGTTTLSDVATGGTWSSSITTTATIDPSSGVVTGVGAVGGTTVISYTTGCGSAATTTITIVATPGAISASTSTVCSGLPVTLSDAAAGGTWSSSNTGIATVNASTGAVVAGTTGGVAIITYFTGCGSAVTTSITVTAAPGPIAGATTVCSPSGTTTLSDAAAGGTWTSSITTTATIDPSSGLVTAKGGVGTTTTITYSTGCGTDATTTITATTTPGTIASSASTICSGSPATLSDAIAGGAWSSSNTSIATVDPISGAVTGGVLGGTATITYSTGCGSAVTTSITVTAAPTAILGTLSVCAGSGTTLSDAITGGTWSSSTTFAAIGSLSGAVSGTTVGTTTISYSTGCGSVATATFTVLGVPGSISGTSTLCSGIGTTLSDAVTGGTWSTSSTTVATININTGFVTAGAIAGTATITYSTGCSSAATTTITVQTAPGTISGASTVCSGTGTTLSDGVSGGVWSTSSTSIATVGTSSGLVTGGVAGTAVISYSTGCGSSATASITVLAAPTAISGPSTVCSGSGITLSDAVTGGTWSASSTALATVGSVTGLVTGGVTAGAALITYSTGCGSAVSTSIGVQVAPAAITGASTICSAGSLTLSDAVTGGTWSSSSTSIATVGTSSGFVTGGVTGGTAIITYSTGCGSAATTSVTVTAAAGAISGTLFVCPTSATTLSDAIGGGTWSSSTTTVATIGPITGLVTGGIAGTTTISYTTGCGSPTTKTFTVIATPTAILGASTVCSGSGTTLSDAIPGGVWSTSSTTIATVGASTGLVTGGIAGTVTITYSTGCGSDATKTFTVLTTPTSISASSSIVCSGSAATLSDAVSGGTWTSSNTSVATVIAGTGAITGAVTGGVITVTYSTGCGLAATTSFTVIAAPTAILGASTVCSTAGTTLSDAITGGVWSTSSTTIATVGTSSGFVTGGTAGATTITYSTGCGSNATKTFTVLTTPTSISASSSIVCSGSAATLSDAVSGGTWTSSNTSVATVIAGTGAITGAVTGGVITVTYSTGCGLAATTSFTVIAAPTAILGASTVCSTAGTTLSDAITGGIWSTSSTTIATVGTSSGFVTGGTAGATTITYSTGCGSNATKTFTVLTTPTSISASASVICSGLAATLSDGSSGGTWSSSNTSIATVISGTGALTGAVTGGTVTITYSTGCGSPVTKTFTVIANPTTILGSTRVCAGFGTTLSDAILGGIWSSSNTAVATIGTSSGAITSGIGGTTTISYSTGCGSDATKTFTVLTTPSSITNVGPVCSGSNITLSDPTPGGTWTTSSTTIATVGAGTGVVTGGAIGGTTTITYSTGCGSDVTASVTVTSLPGIITGPSSVCFSSGITLSDASTDGTWSSNSTTIATVDASGNVSGIIPGTAVISYETSCAVSSTTITVLDSPVPISGTLFVCAGLNISLTDVTTGGAWSTDNTTVATVDNTGLVTGGTAGTANITYSTGCGTDAVSTFTVNPQPLMPAIIAVPSAACTGSITALSDGVSGGVWSSSNTLVATVDVSGNVYGIIPGPVTISYTITNSCGSLATSSTMTIEAPPTPAAITGASVVCEGAIITLSDITSGGVWSSDNTSAQVGASGAVLGEAGGTATISYTVSNSCGPVAATRVVTVNPLPAPAAITGYTSAFCAGTTIQLSDVTAGGVWSSNITGIATVSNTGLVRGVFGGSTTIYYSVTNGCGTVPALLVITVDPLAAIGAISGLTSVCVGSHVSLTDTTSGGTWSSSTPSIAAIGSTGVVTGVGTGTATISYAVTNSCGTDAATVLMTVSTLPNPGIITGTDVVCTGHVISLSDSIAGGVWSSDLPSTAIVNAAGSVYGVAAGSDVIRYTMTNSCGSTDAILNIVVLPASSGLCAPTSVTAAATTATELKAFPNPNTGTFTMSLISANDEPVQVVITNLVGEKVMEFTTTTNKENSVGLSTTGIYFVSATTAHGTNVVKVIVAH